MAKNQEFFVKVFEVVRLIPRGRVTSYGAIAKFLGAAKSARIVGYAMNYSHDYDPSIPAHRVVNSQGLLTGKHHFSTPTKMEELLATEGVKVEQNKVVTFPKLFWDPSEELL